MTDGLLLLGGGALLYFGAEWFVAGASSLALALRVPQIVVGLTVVAYGTSAPEAIVGVEAASSGHGDIALANVLGSNVANVGLILGLTALLRPARVDPGLRTRELPVLLASAAATLMMLLDGVIARWEATSLLLGAIAYSAWMIRLARKPLSEARAHASAAAAAADAAGGPAPKSALTSGGTALIGLAVLLVGGRLFVDGAVATANHFGISERVIGLTIVAIGTSLPELMTSVIAARHGHSDLAIGNVVGSNVFNLLLCLGAAALAGRVGATLDAVALDVGMFLVMTVLLGVFIRDDRIVSRAEGGVALGMYLAFMAAVIAEG